MGEYAPPNLQRVGNICEVLLIMVLEMPGQIGASLAQRCFGFR
jgi:hypothetical protein